VAVTDLLIAFAIGVAFGFALERAGLGSARKLTGQFFFRDFTVLKVMFSAILTAMLGTFWLGRLGLIDVAFLYIPDTHLLPQLAGGAIFGLGFALAGLCPGTSCVSAATGRGDGAAVVAGLFAGVTVTGLFFSRLQPFYESGGGRAWTLPQLLHLPYGVVVLLVVAMALAAFAAVNVIAKDIEVDVQLRRLVPPERRRRAGGWLAIAALALGAAAAAARTPVKPATPAKAGHAVKAAPRPASGC